MRISCTVVHESTTRDVLVACDDATPVATLERALAAEVGAHGSWSLRPAADDATVAELGLHHGDVVSFGGHEPVELPTAGLQLHVTGGPCAGLVFALPVGTHEIGRTGPLSWPDRSLSRRHCRLEVTAGDVTVVDLGSTNGAAVDGALLSADEPTPLAPGQLLEIGDSVVEVRSARAAETVVESGDPGWRNFLRPPRIAPYVDPAEIEIPRAPQAHKTRRLPWIAMLLPLPVAGIMAVVYNPISLLFGLMSPIMMLGNYIADRVGGAKDHREEVEAYEASLARAQERLREAVREEEQRLRQAMPDAADVLVTCLLPGRRLWERRRHDPDFLALRLGTHDLPSEVRLTGERTENQHETHAVPVGFDLVTSGVVGLAGMAEEIDRTLRWVVVQLAALHAPRDLTMTFLTTRGSEEWGWLQWVPQLRPADPESVVAMVGLDTDTLTAQVAALSRLLSERQKALKEHSATADSFPAHVVVLHGFREMRAVPGLTELLARGPQVAIFAICVDDHEKSLPERCTATLALQADDAARAVLRRGGTRDLVGVLREGVESAWCDRAMRPIASLRDVGASQEGESLPDSARLLEVLGIDPPTADAVRAGWVMQPESTRMVLGAGLGGPFSLDLKADGPHGLIAGTTGAGKTELLQTMIASLAVANRPDALNFVLVDYKGDGAFKDCVKFPHTVGKVNNLDPHLVVRALASLRAELHYREHFLAEAGVKDIEDYRDLRAKEPHRPPLPRLLIVIDEFAQLFKELPDFVNGLVAISQLGRSLGIHLILATQRPSGVVSPEIRANTNMRIALRVADAGDSTDVLDSPDASRIAKSTPGRAYVRLGAGALQPFQSGRVGGRRPGAVAVDVPPPFVAPLGWRGLAYAPPAPPKTKQAAVAVDDTDLAALVAAVVEAGQAEGVPPQRSPWLEALEERLIAPEHPEPVPGAVPPLAYGRCDRPELQRQEVATWDPHRDGHLLVIGSARSGRSQVLRTLAGAVAAQATPSDVHLYGIDCGNGALSALLRLPHTGSVVSRTESERATRLLARIGEELDRRQRLLTQHGFGDVSEQRASGVDPLPHLLVMLDRWEGFTATLGATDANTDAIMRILREGASLGVHAIITGDRTLAYNVRVSSMTESKLTLRLADRDDYGLVGLTPRDMPDSVPDGRGFYGTGVETQVFLLGDDSTAQGQAQALAVLGERAAARGPVTVAPFRVDPLPLRIELGELLSLRGAASGAAPGGPVAVIGVGGDELTAFEVDYRSGAGFVVGGPGRSGRSTVLRAAAQSWLDTGGQVVVVAPRPGAMRDLDGHEGVLGVVTSDESESRFAARCAEASAPLLIVVDDADGIRTWDAGDHVLGVLRGQRPGSQVLVGGDAESLASASLGWLGELRKGRRGLLLSPQSYGDGELVGLRLPRDLIGGPIQPGRGWLHRGDGQWVQVATCAPLPDQAGV
ncbi:FHA domain-containing protein [Nocardioides sp. TRM66260-LWL]|uniref:FtsK/SpoIIIE domain-containing protein n=1 Tax=Nocardioides sp. TRM66260-LWL TaxID=2874478 RepID=UPI001CC6FBAE|nr:FtsK/SpoIIIE domain-containing protein [Nocardioides sp. TRM66260-LWL]MBZ5735404.1 FHA domain-containing protein [Nocardioides sp. TRM66260-LWL]